MADRDVTAWNLITPEYRTMHENAGHLPNECSQIVQQAFFSNTWMGQYDMPEYTAWFATSDPTPAYRFHRQFLQLLQSTGAAGPLGAEGPVAPRRDGRALRRLSGRAGRRHPPRSARRAAVAGEPHGLPALAALRPRRPAPGW